MGDSRDVRLKNLLRMKAGHELQKCAFSGAHGPADVRHTLLAVSLGLFPVFFLTIRGWTSGFLFFLVLLALAFWRDCPAAWRGTRSDLERMGVIFALASSFAGVLISQLLRGDFSPKALDGPSRILLAIPIFLLLVEKRVNFVRLFQFACPISLLLAVASTTLFPFRWGDRFASYFVDPITFGNYALILGFMSFFSINVLERDGRFAIGLKLAGLVAGVYLSIWSQSRSGWLAGAVLLALWLTVYRGPLRPATRFGIAALALAAALLTYLSLDLVRERVDGAVYDVTAWMSGENPDTSIGFRLSMWRMAFVLFCESPLYGYGDVGYKQLLDSNPYLTSLATPAARLTMYTGPHNDVLANMLQSGIFGLISALSLFLIPAFVFWRGLRSAIPRIHGASLLGLCFVVGLFVSSLGEQVLYLKFLASFYGLMIASLCATALWRGEAQHVARQP